MRKSWFWQMPGAAANFMEEQEQTRSIKIKVKVKVPCPKMHLVARASGMHPLCNQAA
jgi:hypothetical protein